MKPNRWIIKPVINDIEKNELPDFSPMIRQLLVNRNYKTSGEAHAYLEGHMTSDTSPYRLKDMEIVVQRITSAIDNQQKIAIYGDYDVDGVTATALLVQALRALGADVMPYIPNRFEEGYGLNNEAIDTMVDKDVKLVISVDCGIRSLPEAAYALSRGLDLVITDHHEPGDELPKAYAILNPKQPGDEYPFKSLAGVGVAYKLAQAIMETAPSGSLLVTAPDFLDLVALGTVADLVPLIGENRVLVRDGLQMMRKTRRQGLFSLANVSGVQLTNITASQIGYYLGPRLNAAGRLESALAAYELLITDVLEDAGRLATQLDDQNRERQSITKNVQASADALAMADEPDALILIAISPDFNSGVVGLAAARLTETYYLPAIVGQVSSETTRCSCRSIPEFHITKALDECSELLIRHGGHAAAAGFTVGNENLEALKQKIRQIAVRELTGRDLRPTYTADMELSLSEIHPGMIDELKLLQPTGQGNPDALFVTRNSQVREARTVGADGKHLKLKLSDGKVYLNAIGFRLGQHLESLKNRVDLIYSVELNEYNGHTSLQLNIKDIKPASMPD